MLSHHTKREADRKKGLKLLKTLENSEGKLTDIEENDPRLVEVRNLLDPLGIYVEANTKPLIEQIENITRKNNIPKKKIYHEIAEITSLSRSTVQSKLYKTQSFLLRDLKAITNYLNISLEEVIIDDNSTVHKKN